MSARRARASILLALALAAPPGSAGARKRNIPPPPTGELLLDMAEPVIALNVGRVKLRLRVGLEQKRLIELNPDAAERLRADPPDRHFAFEPGFEAQVGRETLKGIQAAVPVTINDRKMIVQVASHGRDCCTGVDGEIGMGLLPYATIRFVRAGTADPGRSADFLIDDDSEHGPQATISVGRSPMFVQFSLERPDSVATASAGAILARAHGGRLDSTGGPTVAAFGVARPTALLSFPRPVELAGFRFGKLPVRIADFAGRFDFPADPAEPGDIVIKKKTEQQAAWPVVMIGRDRMDRCSAALFDTVAHRLTLRCAFDGAS
ncbi:hypothetical protein [Rhizorhabdus argentea]|uniref:hypothetical protein n=1 Tax=Rhizorhabdus argentea TaxID=1387174 RepID=UPI0030ED1F47